MSTTSARSLRRKNKRHLHRSPPGTPHHSRSSSLTVPGFLFVFVTLSLALGAINGQNNLLFWLFGFSIAALIVSGIITGNALMHLRLVASQIDHAEVAKPLRLKYTFFNTSKLLPNFALEILELDADESASHEPGIVLHIRPNARGAFTSQIIPNKRGYLDLAQIRVRTRFPFGLFTKSVFFNMPRSALVYPKLIPVKQHTLDAITSSEDSMNRSANRRGAGLDYFALRQYQPGDPLKTIAWKRSARSSDILVTEFPDPTAELVQLQIESPSQTTSDEQFEAVISLAYSILKEAKPQARIGLSIPGAHIDIHPSTGVAHIDRCARALALLDRNDFSHNTQPRSSVRRTIMLGYSPSESKADLYAQDYLSEPENA